MWGGGRWGSGAVCVGGVVGGGSGAVCVWGEGGRDVLICEICWRSIKDCYID